MIERFIAILLIVASVIVFATMTGANLNGTQLSLAFAVAGGIVGIVDSLRANRLRMASLGFAFFMGGLTVTSVLEFDFMLFYFMGHQPVAWAAIVLGALATTLLLHLALFPRATRYTPRLPSTCINPKG